MVLMEAIFRKPDTKGMFSGLDTPTEVFFLVFDRLASLLVITTYET